MDSAGQRFDGLGQVKATIVGHYLTYLGHLLSFGDNGLSFSLKVKNLKSNLKRWPLGFLKKKATDKEGDRDDPRNCKEMLSYVILGKFTQEIKKSSGKSCVASKK